MDAWIDTYHTVQRLTRSGTFALLTDNAVGTQEEDNLRHLVTNLGRDVPIERIVPFLTTKHSLEYCLSYADRARQHGFRSLVVLGGDRAVGQVRVVEHAWQLRELLRARDASLELGGWANPHADAERQLDFLMDPHFCAEFYLTQIVSHLDMAPVSRFLDTAARRGLAVPGLFGVFYYRSANPKTLDALGGFLPVPKEGLVRQFGSGATAEDVCASTIKALWQAGVRHFYISNLPVERAHRVLKDVLDRAGVVQ
jgi:5,10-methylenetetrahydrofolate reductase